MALRIIHIQVHKSHRLPGAERQPAPDDRERGIRHHKGREHVRAPMAARAVRVHPLPAHREQFIERGEQVPVAASAKLDQRQPGRGMWHEHVQQTVTSPGHLAGEPLALRRDVVHGLPTAGPHLDNVSFHTGFIPSLRRRGNPRQWLPTASTTASGPGKTSVVGPPSNRTRSAGPPPPPLFPPTSPDPPATPTP